MDIIHIKIVLEDQFSGAKSEKFTTVSVPTFEKMKGDIGKTFSHFDKKDQIRYDWKVISVQQDSVKNAIYGE